MRALEHVPDWENDPIELITLPPSARLTTRVPAWYAVAFLDGAPALKDPDAGRRLREGERKREADRRERAKRKEMMR